MQESRKKKKPTKKEMQQKVVDTFKSQLKKNYVKALIQGSEINSQIILDMIDNGKSLDEIKSFLTSSLHNKEIMEKVVMKEKENK